MRKEDLPPETGINADSPGLSEESMPPHDDLQHHTVVSKIHTMALKNANMISEELPETPDQPIEVGNDKSGTFNEISPEEKYEKKYFVFDIETYRAKLEPEFEEYKINNNRGNLVDPKKIAKKDEATVEKFAANPRTGMIILSGFYDSVSKEATQIGLGKATEKIVLQETIEKLNYFMSKNYIMITYNGKSFDIPFLYKRALINGVPLKPIVNYSDLIHPYSNRLHVDLFGVFGEGGKAEWSYLLGLSTEWENQAKEIAKWYIKREFGEIRSKNLEDLKETAMIYEAVKEWNI